MERIIVFGCGNILLGDDGFGPAVIDALTNSSSLQQPVLALDVGTGIREYLLDFALAPEIRPSLLIIIDAVDFPSKEAGEVFEIDLAQIPENKIHDFSLHQFPTVNLLCELQETGIEVRIIAAQVKTIPNQVQPGLSPEITRAVSLAASKIGHILAERTADMRSS